MHPPTKNFSLSSRTVQCGAPALPEARPLVRAQRTEIRYTARNEAQELDFVHPQQLFDLKLTANVPLNNFLIVAPSADADVASSIGHTFLRQEGPGQEYETVLLISPQPFRLDDPKGATTRPAAPAPRGK